MDLFLSVSNSYQFEFCFLFSTSIQFLHDIVLKSYKNSIMGSPYIFISSILSFELSIKNN